MKKPQADPFIAYMLTLPEAERAMADDFFASLSLQLDLGREQNAAMARDFEQAILRYREMGVPLETAILRLSPERMGGFYARQSNGWYPLDSAAKVYPLSMGHGKMAVFRLSVYLKEQVIPELLQIALTFTLRRFPGFAVTLKKGFFWHYMDACKSRYEVFPDDVPPCRAMKLGRTGAKTFRVLYRENRISTEFFHILTDGTGGMVFLKTLAAEYLRLLGEQIPARCGVLDVTAMPVPEETANVFPRVLREKAKGGFADKAALQLGGKKSRVNPCRVLRFKMDAESLHDAAKARGVTVTVYLLSRIIFACRAAMELQKGDISVQVPVNLRKFYPSRTLRNFSLYCGVRADAGAVTDPDALLEDLAQQLAEKGAWEAMDKMVASTEQLVALARYLPLPVKFPVVQAVYGVLGDRLFTTTLSNLGVEKLPQAMEKHVESMDFVLGTARENRALCSMVTAVGTASLCIAKQTEDPTLEETLLALLKKDGLAVTVEGSDVYAS